MTEDEISEFLEWYSPDASECLRRTAAAYRLLAKIFEDPRKMELAGEFDRGAENADSLFMELSELGLVRLNS